MKNKVLFTTILFAAALAGCKKDDPTVSFVSATNPVLTASSSSALVLTGANAAANAIAFTWTNPNYRFTTGISSQDVTYTLQADTTSPTGKTFSSGIVQESSVSKELGTSYTVKDLNGILTKMNLLENIPHSLEFRLKASLVNGALPLYSNVIKMMITPYLDVAVPVPPTGDLYITGNAFASDWTNSPPAAQKFTKLSNTLYTITVPFVAGKQYKFLSTLGQWQPQYGGSSATGGNLGFNMGGGSDPDAIPTPSASGNYKITVNFKTGVYTVEKQ